MIETVAVRWSLAKIALGEELAVTPDALHVLIGTCLFVAAHRLLPFRWRWLAWPGLLAIECGNELLDWLRPAGLEAGWADSVHDIALTMLLPTLLTLARPALSGAMSPSKATR